MQKHIEETKLNEGDSFQFLEMLQYDLSCKFFFQCPSDIVFDVWDMQYLNCLNMMF